MSILVTGGSGFVGSTVCECLARSGEDVISLDVKPFEFGAKEGKRIKTSIGDVTDFEALLNIVKRENVKEIVAVGAVAGTGKAAGIPLTAFRVNVLGIANLLEVARVTDLDRVIFTSSLSVYGNRANLASLRETDPLSPDTVYRRTKLIAEQVCEMYRENFGMRITIIRLGLVYGPRLPSPSLMLPTMLYHAMTDGKVKISAGAADRVDYVYVKDLGEGIVLAHRKKDHSFPVYNFGSGKSVSPNDIATTIKEIFPSFDYKIGPGYSDPHPQLQGPMDISRAISDFSYKVTPMKEAIVEYAAWLREKPERLAALRPTS